jgi:pyridoxine kinase
MSQNPLPPRVLAIHDICGIGRCSLVSAISILSHLGNSVCPLATASFSTNTSYGEFNWEDLSNTLIPFLEDFDKKKIDFQSIYSGYLGSEKQTEAVLKAIHLWPNAYKVIDPVFADKGALYSHFSLKIVDSFKELIRHADLITPNTTEASYLISGRPDQVQNLAQAEEALEELSNHRTRNVIITSVEDPSLPGKVGIMAYDKKSHQRFEFFSEKRKDISFCGTGDVLTSTLLGLILSGRPFEEALSTAFNFISDAIDHTLTVGGKTQEGIIFEPLLKDLI